MHEAQTSYHENTVASMSIDKDPIEYVSGTVLCNKNHYYLIMYVKISVSSNIIYLSSYNCRNCIL